jgi:hypothetical protein
MFVGRNNYPYYSAANKPMLSAYSARELALEEQINRHKSIIPTGQLLKHKLVWFREMVFHSISANIYFLQESNRTQFPLLKIPLVAMFAFHILLYLRLLFVVLFGIRWMGFRVWLILFTPPLLLQIVILFIVNITEQRYTQIVEAWMLVAFALTVYNAIKNLQKSTTNNSTIYVYEK